MLVIVCGETFHNSYERGLIGNGKKKKKKKNYNLNKTRYIWDSS